MTTNTENRELTEDELVAITGGNVVVDYLIGKVLDAAIDYVWNNRDCIAGCGSTGGIFWK